MLVKSVIASYYTTNNNRLGRLVFPGKIKHWSLRSLLVKLIKKGSKVVRHSRYVRFLMAEVKDRQKVVCRDTGTD